VTDFDLFASSFVFVRWEGTGNFGKQPRLNLEVKNIHSFYQSLLEYLEHAWKQLFEKN